ncbi:unnamed protein product [Amoebophrya sp. A25]|nr:unnamed protein product [Amoebophrya sp. A25]|eukprot:GSA25T00002329001.1
MAVILTEQCLGQRVPTQTTVGVATVSSSIANNVPPGASTPPSSSRPKKSDFVGASAASGSDDVFKNDKHDSQKKTNRDGLFFAEFSPCDAFVAASDSSGRVHLLHAANDFEPLRGILECGRTKGKQRASGCASVAFKWRPEGGHISQKSLLTVARTDGFIQQFHASTGRSLGETDAYEAAVAGGNGSGDPDALPALFCIDYVPDGSQFATGGKEPEVFIFDEMTKKKMMTLQRSDKNGGGHNSRVCACKFSSRSLLVTGGWDSTLQFWDLRKGSRSVQSVYGPSLTGPASLDVSGPLVLTGSYRQQDSLQLFDMRKLLGGSGTGVLNSLGLSSIDQVADFAPRDVQLTTAQFSASGSHICIAGSNRDASSGFLRVSGKMDLVLHSGSCSSAMFANKTENLVVCTSRDGVLRVLQV